MPTNGGPIEKILYGLNGIPIFTYGMIGITTLVLAYITLTDIEVENPLNSINPVSEIQKPTEEASELIIPSEGLEPTDGEGVEKIDGEVVEKTDGEGVEKTDGEGLEPTGQGVDKTDGEGVEKTDGEGLEPTGQGVDKTDGEGVQTTQEPITNENIQPIQPEIKKQGGKKRTIRNKKKGRKTIRR